MLKQSLRGCLKSTLASLFPKQHFMLSGPSRHDLHGNRRIYLTFDDGPSEETTPQILDALRRARATATFFVVGLQAEQFPNLVRQIVAEGHQIGTHTFSHPNRKFISASQWHTELRRSDEILTEILGCTSRLFRPPYGKVAMTDLMHLRRQQKTLVLWNQDPKDFALRSETELKQWFFNRSFAAGDIVLLHDTEAATAEALPDILKNLQQHFEFAGCADGLPGHWHAANNSEVLTVAGL